MSVRRCTLRAFFTALALSPLLLMPQVPAVSPAAGASGDSGPQNAEVELFAAVQAGQLRVTVVPRDSRRVTMQFANQSDRPLSVRLPTAFAASPVLGQIDPFGGGNGLGFNLPGGAPLPAAQANHQPQNLGGAFGPNVGLGLGNGFNALGNGAGPARRLPGLFHIPPGKVIKKRFATVCLDFGKPEPKPQIPYRLMPLERVNSKPELRELMELSASQRFSQRITQLAAWHLSNEMSWDELARLKYKRANGYQIPRFSLSELRQAQRIVSQLPSRQDQQVDATRSQRLR